MTIPGYDDSCACIQGAFQNPVVVRVRAIGDCLLRRDTVGQGPEIGGRFPHPSRRPGEFLAKDALHLGLDRAGNRELDLSVLRAPR